MQEMAGEGNAEDGRRGQCRRWQERAMQKMEGEGNAEDGRRGQCSGGKDRAEEQVSPSLPIAL